MPIYSTELISVFTFRGFLNNMTLVSALWYNSLKDACYLIGTCILMLEINREMH